MLSPIEKSFGLIEYTKTNSCMTAQGTFRKQFHMDLPPQALVQSWFDNFENQEYKKRWPSLCE
jgi:hypothetical protein